MTTPARKTRAADDKPFDFNLDALKSEKDLSPFRVHWDGRRWELTHMEELDVWPLIESADMGDQAAMMAVFRTAMGDQRWEDFRKIRMPQWKFAALWENYELHCGVEPGESDGSTES